MKCRIIGKRCVHLHRIDLDGENIDIHWSFAPGESE